MTAMPTLGYPGSSCYDERHDARHRHPGVNRGKGRGVTKPPAAKRRHRRK